MQPPSHLFINPLSTQKAAKHYNSAILIPLLGDHGWFSLHPARRVYLKELDEIVIVGVRCSASLCHT